ncbi:MAG TPA: carboxymuconolactone decarboxylase family protein [Bryobacteraceae bacterium]|nr:carboxymuconolactone decarboxylase family protein [Bryobacteraceae bacterium]
MARMKHPVMIYPEAMQALQALKAATDKGGVPAKTLELIELRASQINSCGTCVDGHARVAKRHGETDERLFALPVWRHAPYFTDAERAALALTEAVTRMADRDDPVPDEVWNEAARHYDENALAALIINIANINVWNRLNGAVKQLAGDWKV